MTWLVGKAARGAVGLAFLFGVVALAFAWAAYRLCSWPLRRLAKDSPAAAKRQAVFQLVGAIAVFAGTMRAARDLNLDDDVDEPEPEVDVDKPPGYTPLP